MIKINLVREGKAAVRGAAASGPVSSAPANINNLLIIALVIAGLLISGGYWFLKSHALSQKDDEVRQRKADADRLQTIINEVEGFKKQKDSLQKRIDLINQLKQNQKGPVKIMDRISQDLPDLVWLDTMQENAGQIVLNGRGLNPNAIANFVENVKADPLFEEPELGNMTQVASTTNVQVYAFDMTFHFSYAPKKPGEATGTAAATTTGSSPGSTTTSGVPGGKGQ